MPDPGQKILEKTAKRPQARSVVSRYAMASLRQPESKDVGKLVEEMICDPIVAIADHALRAYIASAETQVTITGGGHRGQILQNALQNLWLNHLSEMLMFIRYGRAAFEKVEEYSKELNLTYIKELIYLDYEHSELRVTKEGLYDGIEIRKTRIDPECSWWLALNPTAKNPYGTSHYIGATEKVWRERTTATCLRNDASILFVIDNGVWAVPMETEYEDNQTVDEAGAFASSMAAKRSGGAVLVPNSQIRVGEGVYVDAYRCIQKPEIRDPAPLNENIAVLNTELLLSAGVPPSAVLESEVGSFAKASIQMTVLYAICELILGQAERSFKKNVVTPNLSQNFQKGEVSCSVTHVPLAKKNQIQAGQNPNDPNNNPLVAKDEEDEENQDPNMAREDSEGFNKNLQQQPKQQLTIRSA